MAWPKGGNGRAGGSPNGATVRMSKEGREFCKKILEGGEYLESLMRRIKADTLPMGIEQLLYFYAYGKPVENIDVTVNEAPQDLSGMTEEELAQRAELLARVVRAEKLKHEIGIDRQPLDPDKQVH